MPGFTFIPGGGCVSGISPFPKDEIMQDHLEVMEELAIEAGMQSAVVSQVDYKLFCFWD